MNRCGGGLISAEAREVEIREPGEACKQLRAKTPQPMGRVSIRLAPRQRPWHAPLPERGPAFPAARQRTRDVLIHQYVYAPAAVLVGGLMRCSARKGSILCSVPRNR